MFYPQYVLGNALENVLDMSKRLGIIILILSVYKNILKYVSVLSIG